MAIKSRRSASSNDDAIETMLRPIQPLPVVSPTIQTPVTDQILSIFEGSDERFYHPSGTNRSARDLVGRAARLGHFSGPFATLHRQKFGAVRLGFQNPKIIVECIRRKARRQVLFANRLRGRGSGAKRRRQGPYSQVRC